MFTFYKQKKWIPEKLRGVPKVIQVVNGEAEKLSKHFSFRVCAFIRGSMK